MSSVLIKLQTIKAVDFTMSPGEGCNLSQSDSLTNGALTKTSLAVFDQRVQSEHNINSQIIKEDGSHAVITETFQNHFWLETLAQIQD